MVAILGMFVPALFGVLAHPFRFPYVKVLPTKDAKLEGVEGYLLNRWTGPESAARTGLTEGSVRVNLHRGMKQLRERIRGSAGAKPSGKECS